MSFIFEALKKHDNKPAPSVPIPQQATTHIVQTDTGSSTQQAFSWGLLLALAILGAVVIGFVLGRMSVSYLPPAASSQTQITSQVVQQPSDSLQTTGSNPEQSFVVQAEPKVQSKIKAEVPAQKLVQTVPIKRETAPEKKIAAEDYFENPPAKNVVLTAEQTLPQEQKVVSAQKKDTVFEPEMVSQAEGVSDNLLARFQQAITDEKQSNIGQSTEGASEQTGAHDSIPALHEKPMWLQDSVPRLNFSMHMFSSQVSDSWIRVNGQDKFVGDTIAGNITLVAIEPQHVVLELQGEQFSLPALSTW